MSEEHAIRTGVLNVQVADENGGQTIRLSGELDLANAGTVEAELDRALDAGGGQVIVDLTDLSFIDSTGIALLINAAAREGAEERLRFVPSQGLAVQRVLKATGLEDRLPFIDGES